MDQSNPMINAAMQGIQSGMQQAQSSPPSAYQPQGVQQGRNILCGSLKLIVDQLNKLGSLLNSQGLTELATDLYKASMQTNTVCGKLEKEAQGDGQQ